MSWVAVGTGVASLGVSAFKYFKGKQQERRAKAMQPQDPGFTRNQALIDNARIYGDRYNNYTMPGYSQLASGINSSSQFAFDQGVQGATSSGDVLDLAARTQLARQQGLNQLGLTNAQLKEQALDDYLRANVMAGQEDVRINSLELDRYNQQQREAAALEQAGVTNQYSAIGEGISGLNTMSNSLFSPQWTTDEQGRMVQGQSRWNQWLNNRKTNG